MFELNLYNHDVEKFTYELLINILYMSDAFSRTGVLSGRKNWPLWRTDAMAKWPVEVTLTHYRVNSDRLIMLSVTFGHSVIGHLFKFVKNVKLSEKSLPKHCAPLILTRSVFEIILWDKFSQVRFRKRQNWPLRWKISQWSAQSEGLSSFA